MGDTFWGCQSVKYLWGAWNSWYFLEWTIDTGPEPTYEGKMGDQLPGIAICSLVGHVPGMAHVHISPHTSFKLNYICLQEYYRFPERSNIYCRRCYKRPAFTLHYTVKASHYTLQTSHFHTSTFTLKLLPNTTFYVWKKRESVISTFTIYI